MFMSNLSREYNEHYYSLNEMLFEHLFTFSLSHYLIPNDGTDTRRLPRSGINVEL